MFDPTSSIEPVSILEKQAQVQSLIAFLRRLTTQTNANAASRQSRCSTFSVSALGPVQRFPEDGPKPSKSDSGKRLPRSCQHAYSVRKPTAFGLGDSSTKGKLCHAPLSRAGTSDSPGPPLGPRDIGCLDDRKERGFLQCIPRREAPTLD